MMAFSALVANTGAADASIQLTLNDGVNGVVFASVAPVNAVFASGGITWLGCGIGVSPGQSAGLVGLFARATQVEIPALWIEPTWTWTIFSDVQSGGISDFNYVYEAS